MSEILRRPGARSIAVTLVAWAVVAAVSLAVLAATTRPIPKVPQDGSLGPANRATPLFDARVMTVKAAESAAGYTIPMPTAAGLPILTKVWESPNHEVALVFARDKVTLLIRPATYTDPAVWFRKIVAESPGRASVGRVNGRPAVVIQPNTDPYGPNPTWVEFYRDGLDINVISTSDKSDTLVSIADSIK